MQVDLSDKGVESQVSQVTCLVDKVQLRLKSSMKESWCCRPEEEAVADSSSSSSTSIPTNSFILSKACLVLTFSKAWFIFTFSKAWLIFSISLLLWITQINQSLQVLAYSLLSPPTTFLIIHLFAFLLSSSLYRDYPFLRLWGGVVSGASRLCSTRIRLGFQHLDSDDFVNNHVSNR